MKSCFVPPYYQCDLCLKLQTLKQGDKGVEEYYQELLIGLARCGIREDDDEISARFFGGLNRDIQNILDYKEWTHFSQLYHLALKAEREVQARHQDQLSFRSNIGRLFQQRFDVEKPKTPVAKLPATPPAPAPAPEISNVSTMQTQQHMKHTTLEKGSSSRSANIVCHRCKGMGHVMKDCPSTRAFIAAPDGNGYVSASDVEDDLVLAANIVADSEEDEGEAIDPIAAMTDFPSLLEQRVLTSKAEHEDEKKLQRKNLFHMFLIVQDCRVLTIIDSGSCSNLVSSDLIKRFGLPTHSIP